MGITSIKEQSKDNSKDASKDGDTFSTISSQVETEEPNIFSESINDMGEMTPFYNNNANPYPGKIFSF